MHKLPRALVLLGVLFIVWRLLLQLSAFFADTLFSYNPTFPYAYTLLPQFSPYRTVYSWANFDGVHYLTIVQKGYEGTALIQAFFPAYPFIILLLGKLLPFSVLGIGLSLSHLCFMCALIVLWKLLAVVEASTVTKMRTLAVLLFFPTSFFFASLYTESLFLLSALLVFWCAHKRIWWGVALAGIVASATRVVGVAAVVAVLIEYLFEKKGRFSRNDIPVVLLCAGGSFGLIAYMVYLWITFQDPLFFLHVQSEFGAGRQETLVLLPQVLWRGVKIIFYSDINWRWWTSLQELVYTLAFGATLLYAFWKRSIVPHSWLIFSTLCLIIPTMTGTLSSMPRYVLVLFPVFYIWATVRLSWPKWMLIFLLFIVGLVLNTLLFLQGYWVA